MIIQECW